MSEDATVAANPAQIMRSHQAPGRSAPMPSKPNPLIDFAQGQGPIKRGIGAANNLATVLLI